MLVIGQVFAGPGAHGNDQIKVAASQLREQFGPRACPFLCAFVVQPLGCLGTRRCAPFFPSFRLKYANGL